MAIRCRLIIVLLSVMLLVAACGAPESNVVDATPPPATATSLPPTETPPQPQATATPLPPTALPPIADSGGGLIAFYSDRDGNPEIYVMAAPDGPGAPSEPTRLTNDPAFDDSPALSPDGTRIAFLTARHDPNPKFPDLKYELYALDIDGDGQNGANLHRLTTTEVAETHPAWSPDGAKISFDADYDGDGYYEIYAIDADGANLTRLTSGQANDQFADWSPDGRQIAFASDRNGNWDLYVMDTNGDNQRQLTDSPNWELFPAWSPDGRQIAYNGLRPRSRNTDIYVLDLNGERGSSNVRQLTDTPYFDENPAWSPDGKQIVFQTARDGNFEIYIMNADGSEQRLLAPHPGEDLWPSWGRAAAAPATTLALTKSPQEFGKGTFQVGLGDLDGDGDLDAVFANPLRHNSAVWLNDGGQFTDTGQELTQYGHGVGLADFDGDGDLDVFIACHYFVSPSQVYLNDGSGNLQATGQDLGDASISGANLNLVDLDGDGDMDVHVMYYDPKGLADKVYLNGGDGSFSDSGLVLDEEVIAWGDLDADGDADYLGKRYGEGYVTWLNDGRGQFAEGWQMADAQAMDGGIALADFDGDGDLDALIANGFRSGGSYPTILLWNDGQAQFVDSGLRFNATMSADFAVGDLDGDGDLDVFVSNFDLPNEVWLNNGSGRLNDSGLRLGHKGDSSTEPSLGDLDGDGDLDLFVGSLQGQPELWFNETR